ncbi:MAG: hypothetical protein Q7T16_02350 [Candidatus Burarchaeum sp.]|nr:hypothetical protein [Candidatus Burarchaeum sp.]MDO8339475.1 hypothetical protein [Candidatus Burarchaeum sp.]
MGRKTRKGTKDFLKEYRKRSETAGAEDAYRVYEEFAPKLNWDISGIQAPDYWKVMGEAIGFFGETKFFECRETLQGTPGYRDDVRNRPDYMNWLVSAGMKKEMLKVFPEKCPECGFHRFFAVTVLHWSVADTFKITCPNCGKKLAEGGYDKW